MDYFQGVVTEYLRAKRSMFVNTECLIQLEPGKTPAKGRHWYCDAMVVSFSESTAYLCEVTYSSSLHALVQRLQAWSTHWPDICFAIARDCAIPHSWAIKPWVFIPEDRSAILEKKFPMATAEAADASRMPYPRISYLEKIVPWKYSNTDRQDDIEEINS